MNKVLIREILKAGSIAKNFNNYISYLMNGLITENLLKLFLKEIKHINIIVGIWLINSFKITSCTITGYERRNIFLDLKCERERDVIFLSV